MRKGSKRLLQAGILSGLAYTGWRVWQAQVAAQHRAISWETAPFPFPPVPRRASAGEVPASEARAEPAADGSVEPNADGACPVSHPVKAKLTSGIYHEPGGGNYDRTKADRCYVDAAAAEADGLRAVKR
jgi:hypothetical protein